MSIRHGSATAPTGVLFHLWLLRSTFASRQCSATLPDKRFAQILTASGSHIRDHEHIRPMHMQRYRENGLNHYMMRLLQVCRQDGREYLMT